MLDLSPATCASGSEVDPWGSKVASLEVPSSILGGSNAPLRFQCRKVQRNELPDCFSITRAGTSGINSIVSEDRYKTLGAMRNRLAHCWSDITFGLGILSAMFMYIHVITRMLATPVND